MQVQDDPNQQFVKPFFEGRSHRKGEAIILKFQKL